ncbi:hypothetical protein CLOM_g8141 [Closterium sp. NIES-68]|nr:hypothetical protein CLOM_g8141 [Closterium sp. NIES-68]GJP74924.1 hypothetical protein CLOP_g5440 [Closterium sp. NIES-67]
MAVGVEKDAPRLPKKIIIDTDPGIDDTMAILLAFLSPLELDVVGITTVFGNVRTPTATANALSLCELAGREDVPVAHGEEVTLRGVEKIRVADFVHGSDGMGNTNQQPPRGKPTGKVAAQFLVDAVRSSPGQITVVALGPLTNVARALQLDPSFPRNVAEIVILGGAFFTNGNVNPAAEANIFGDPDAADAVFTCGAKCTVIGINITHQVTLSVKDMEDIRDSKGPFGRFIHETSQFYYQYHKESYGMDAVYLHDPTTMVAAMDDSLFTFHEGVVRVQLDGIAKGLTLLNSTNKVWNVPTAWCGLPPVRVAVTVDADAISALVKQRLSTPPPSKAHRDPAV